LSSKSEELLVTLRKKILSGNCSYLAQKILNCFPQQQGACRVDFSNIKLIVRGGNVVEEDIARY
jgi:hypothetical protein